MIFATIATVIPLPAVKRQKAIRALVDHMEAFDRQGIAQNQYLGAVPYRKSGAIFSGPTLVLARTTHCGGEPAKPGNRLTAGLGDRREPAGQDVFFLSRGLDPQSAGAL